MDIIKMDTSQKKDDSLRKVSKQEMERRRRARMNVSLDKLKSIMQKAGFIDDSDGIKMEKAEILDRVVDFCEQLVDRTAQNQNQKKHFTITPCFDSQFHAIKTEETISLSKPNKPTNRLSAFTDISANKIKLSQRMPLSMLNSNQLNIIGYPQSSEKRVFNPKFTAELNRYWNSQKQIWKPYE